MSDKTGAPRPSRGGSGVILTGLAVGALLGTSAAAPAVADPSPAADSVVAARSCGGEPHIVIPDRPETFIRAQFQASFTAGAVREPRPDVPIICEPSA